RVVDDQLLVIGRDVAHRELQARDAVACRLGDACAVEQRRRRASLKEGRGWIGRRRGERRGHQEGERDRGRSAIPGRIGVLGGDGGGAGAGGGEGGGGPAAAGDGQIRDRGAVVGERDSGVDGGRTEGRDAASDGHLRLIGRPAAGGRNDRNARRRGIDRGGRI